MSVGIDLGTLPKQDFAVAALLAAHKEDQVMSRCKLPELGHSVCHLAAYRVIISESCAGRFLRIDSRDHFRKTLKRLGGLRIEHYVIVIV